MGRRLRFIPPGGAVVEVTCRTLQARLLLQPTPSLREITLGIVGRSQRLYGVDIHAFVFLSNHYHLLVSVRDAEQLARFVGYLNSNLAREVARLHDWHERVWGRRYQGIVVSDEEEAQVDRLLYLLRNGCKEGLVGDPLEWPGATSLPAMLDGEPLVGTWFDRTAECLARRRGGEPEARAFVSEEAIVLSPLPAWAHLEAGERKRRVNDLLDLVRAEAAARCEETGLEPLGPVAVARLGPYGAPVRSQRGPAPLVHAIRSEARQAFHEAYRRFAGAYRRAVEALRAGTAPPEFPAGCFPPAWKFVKAAAA